MKLPIKIALVTGALALGASPTALAAGKPDGVPPSSGTDNGKPANPTPGPKAGLPAKAKAYGRYCKGESKKHEKGQRGTDFSRCVTAMAKAANHESMAPGRACKAMSRKHTKGEKGTPFSRCVRDAAKLRRHQHDQEGGSEA